ncbi:putative ATP-dependent endonuclease of OLD family [Nitrosomonas oligotropha]|jgi:predicted ATP-dependent endonuclease of OLD family|uniref:Putative ATP-dependent endonuclease of OLD family n=1 Tax=Nitrosomonas oligotropha TaxID=42354 RepID=A0A2T5HXT4_9PROT|nr:ATP-dependent endonuclease [Nitrosomonas oligotropha]PTQ76393.1 putative ATP-dependent endonuclease of OLD family [Nitrosomonas oligotropha]
MHIHALRIKNFRRLRDVQIDLNSDISIFVGANNSGKTSTAQALQLFTAASRDRFSIHDFNSECWGEIDAFGDQKEGAILPRISIDIWFHVEAADLHRVVDLLPSLSWEGSLVGLRIEFGASDETALLTCFNEARAKAKKNIRLGQNGNADYHPLPRTLCEYLEDNLRREFELRYYVLDHARFNASFVEAEGYEPLQITPDKGRGGKEVLNSLMRVDFLNAQRHLSDSTGGSRTEDLSRCLSRFYDRNLEKRGDDYDAMRALTDSEALLNDHLARVFDPTLRRLADLGYPGLTNPRLLIKSVLNPATIMSSHDGARVHYALGEPHNGVDAPTLPDRYNGLGFKNLIYMVVELLDLHTQWLDIEENRPPLHLVFIEEPEAHLHAQLQQVFIHKVLDILSIKEEDATQYRSQLVVTTHSPHILYERGFRPIRYFRRYSSSTGQSSEVLNLSAFYADTENPTRDFLERYLKLTHCDLFFADAAVLVEGNVERLLIPQMVEKTAPRLKSSYLSIIEIGGAFGYRFRSLIEFLGITALIVTDIDSVIGASAPAAENDNEAADEIDDQSTEGSACPVLEPGAVTSNQTLIQWLPGKTMISDLLAATAEKRTQLRTEKVNSLVRITYQTQVDVTWQGVTESIVGRTLEEAFALENLEWCQDKKRSDLKLRIPKNETLSLGKLADRLHKRIKSTSFKKTDFALALLAEEPKAWAVPDYIAKGLHWLQDEVTPLPPTEHSVPVVDEVVT